VKRHKIDRPKLYHELAWLWPILSPPEDYVQEATIFANTIKKNSHRPPKTLLDLGCGGGHNDMTLKKHFLVTGVDLSGKMLALASKLNPEIEYIRGDMRNVRLGRKFDAVAIFDSINYMLSEDDLRRAFRTAYQHLNPGGVFITYLEETKESFTQGKAHSKKSRKDDVELTYIERLYDPIPEDKTYESTMVYLIRKGGELEVFVDRHILGIFRTREVIAILAESGFETMLLKFKIPGEDECPMLVGVKPL